MTLAESPAEMAPVLNMDGMDARKTDFSARRPTRHDGSAWSNGRPHEEPVEDARIPDYPDTGCRYFPSCLACPLPRCVEEIENVRERMQFLAMVGIAPQDGRSWPQWAADARALQIVRLQRQGLTMEQTAQRVGLGVRQTRRIAAQYRQAS